MGGLPFSLRGEIDKSGNPHFENGPYSGAELDLLVHAPGDMDRNLAVVEVKSANVGLGGIRDDLRKLTWFCQNARYFRGIFLMYGEAGDADRVAQTFENSSIPPPQHHPIHGFGSATEDKELWLGGLRATLTGAVASSMGRVASRARI